MNCDIKFLAEMRRLNLLHREPYLNLSNLHLQAFGPNGKLKIHFSNIRIHLHPLWTPSASYVDTPGGRPLREGGWVIHGVKGRTSAGVRCPFATTSYEFKQVSSDVRCFPSASLWIESNTNQSERKTSHNDVTALDGS